MKMGEGRGVWLGRCFSALLAVAILSSACSSRNLRKRATFPAAPVERGVSYSTRVNSPDAGVDPVEFAAPLITENLVILPSETAGIEARDRYDFSRKWRLAMKNGVGSQPVLDGGTVYFGASDGRFYAVDVDLGIVRWHYETKAPVFSKPMVAGNRVYFMASDDVLYCLEKDTGKWVWHYKRTISTPTTIRGNSTPVLDGDRVLAGFSDGYFVALGAKDGNLRWETHVHRGSKFTDVDAEAVVDGKQVFVPSYDGGLYTLDRESGRVQWFTDVGGSKRVVLEEGGKTLYLAASDGRVLSMDKESGKVNWAFELDLGAPTEILMRGTYLVFGSSRQYLYVVRKGDGSLAYRFNAGLRSGFSGAPVAAPLKQEKNPAEEFYIYSNFGTLYGFSWKRPAKEQKALFGISI